MAIITETGKVLLKIGEVSQKINLSAPTIRHYTNLGLLQITTYTKGGQYLYDEETVLEQLNYICELSKRGLTLEAIKEQLNVKREKKKALIISNDIDFAKFQKNMLITNYPSWIVEISTNVFNAGYTLLDLLPDLVVLDIRLIGVDGFEISKFIRSNLILKYTKILAITAYDSFETKKKILQCGADVCLTKDVDINIFLSEIKKLLNVDDQK